MMKKKNFIALMIMGSFLFSACGERKEPQRDPIKVKTMMLSSSITDDSQNYSGTIEEMNGTALSMVGGGTLKQLNISEGQMVSKGQLIATVDGYSQSSAVTASQAQTQQAKNALSQVQDYYKRMKLIHDNGSLPEVRWIEAKTQLKQAESVVQAAKAGENISRKTLTDTHLYAPFSGYISAKMAEVGQNIGPGMPVAILVKIDQVKVKVSVPEDEIAKIQKGQQVWLRVASANGKVFMGQITEKGVLANPISRSYEVKAMIENPNHELLPGMVCQVRIRGEHASQSIVVPANIVQLTPDNKTFVWTVKGNKAQKKYITLGENMTDGVKVESGLSLGDKVIIEGQQKISTGMTIKEENCKE